MKIERNLIAIIVFFGTFQLSHQQICDESRYIQPFLEALDGVADQIIEAVPDWVNYNVRQSSSLDNKLLFFSEERQRLFFEPEIYFDYGQPKATTDQLLSSPDSDAICDERGFRYNRFPIYSVRRNHPYKILRWLHSNNQIEEFVVQISKKNSSLGLRYEENNITRKSIRSIGLNITYFANQIYGNESRPSVCELYFYIRGDERTWNSGQDQVSFTFGEDDDEQRLNVTGTLENVIVGFMLLSRTEGKQVNSTSIDEVMKIVLKSLPRVLCNPSLNKCDDDEFDCRCGKDIYQSLYPSPTCIPNRWRCDGTPDCPDGRDEDNCICPEGFFQCGCEKGGTCPYRFECIPNSYLCDGIKDCDSYKDEGVNECAFNCTKRKQSIRNTLRCDGKRDCKDFTDEANCHKRPPGLPYRCDCAKDDFDCTGDYSFYPEEERCNGKKFCGDFSDEWNCTSCPSERPLACDCNKKENFTCENEYSCFSDSSICDLKADCSDNTDENNCTAYPCPVDRPLTCDCNQYLNFTCDTDHFCYNEEDKCDGWNDCNDGTDEKDCENSNLEYSCECGIECPMTSQLSFTESDGKETRISVTFTRYSSSDGCDGYKDCNDSSDEDGCVDCFKIPEKPFSCACNREDSTCEDKYPLCLNETEYKCDGVAQCSDSSDEWFCPCPESKPFECGCKNLTNSEVCLGDDQCFTEADTCDGFEFCNDSTDEVQACLDCPTAQFPHRCGCNVPGSSSCVIRACYSDSEACNEANECGDWSDERNCTWRNCTYAKCDCNGLPCTEGPNCYPEEELCDGKKYCDDGTDENDCSMCPNYRNYSCECNMNDTCQQGFPPCFTEEERCDGTFQCSDRSDEWNCSCGEGFSPCDCKSRLNDHVCAGEKSCFNIADVCNGLVVCEDKSDEWNCPCPSPGSKNISCACKEFRNDSVCYGSNICYSDADKCNSIDDCNDGNDEMNCSCPVGMFNCNCFTANNPTCSKTVGCIEKSNANDGEYLCEDKSDEQYLVSRVDLPPCGLCTNLTIFRLNERKGCNEIDSCDNTTCKEVVGYTCRDLDCNETNFICFSKCINNTDTNCKTFFQCQNKEIILSHNFCNEQVDCEDGSDETYTGFGFKCSASEESTRSCVLPQWNLKDEDTFQCNNNTDSCKGDFGCFDCVNNPSGQLRISNRHVCDGTINCEDLSDECLCQNINYQHQICLDRFAWNNHLKPNPICVKVDDNCSIAQSIDVSEATCRLSTRQDTNNTCQSKSREIVPTYCDKIPECIDFEDECNENICGKPLPKYCEDPCKDFFQIGDRYCNGFNDDAWMYLNDDACPKGFDELPELCEDTRFSCIVNGQSKVPQVSIPRIQLGDGFIQCDDGSDEEDYIFSSRTEMIKIDVIRIVICIIAIIILITNASVFITTTHILKTKKLHKILRTNHILILNLSIADFLMGIYLLIIFIKSVEFSGRYGEEDLRWRSSDLCTVVGTVAIISSETSCFIMTILTSFRLVTLLRPIKSLTASTTIWFVILGFAWMASCLIAIVPLIPQFGDIFIYQVLFDSPFVQNRLLRKDDILLLTCRYKSLLNLNDSKSLETSTWHDIMKFSQNNFPKFEAKLVGFYGETSVCMPRLFVDNSDIAGPYSIFIISINFISFCYVCLSYALIYKKTSNRPISKKRVEIQNNKMQKRIARLLVTDFVCWVPLCIVAFVKYTTDIEVSNDIYFATFAFFLHVNSALNPILYSTWFEKLFRTCIRKLQLKRLSYILGSLC